MAPKKSKKSSGRGGGRNAAKPRASAGRPTPAPEVRGLTKREVLQWLAGLSPDDIHAVLMAVGRDPDVEELDLHGGPEELVGQLEGARPRLENLVAAIDEALGIDEEALGRQVRGEFEPEPEIELEAVEAELDDVLRFGPGEDEDEVGL